MRSSVEASRRRGSVDTVFLMLERRRCDKCFVLKDCGEFADDDRICMTCRAVVERVER